MGEITRRGLASATLALAAAPALAKPAAPPQAAAWPDATELAAMIRRKEISAVEAVSAAIARAEALQPKLNVLVNSDFDRALQKAKAGAAAGPFAGVPFLIKDLDDYRGLPTRNGSRSGLAAGPATQQPDYISAFDRAGLVVIGKSATPEYGFLPTTEPLAFGPTHNPWDLTRSSGGSSGGSAAAVAAGIVPAAHANDGGGSIRIPASCCGLFGLKPSRGRVPRATAAAAAGELGVDHAVSRSVRDSALLLDLLAGNADRPLGAPGTFLSASREPCKPLNIAYVTEPMLAPSLSADSRAALEDAAQLANSLGHNIEPVSLGIDYAAVRHAFLTLWSVTAEDLVLNAERISGRKPLRAEFEISTWAMAHVGRKLGERGLPAALEEQRRITARLTDLLNRYDVILCATLAAPPIKIGEMQPTSAERMQMRAVTAMPLEALMKKVLAEASNKAFTWAGCTELFNLSGQPAMSVPLYWTARGLPVGVQFAAREGGEATLLRLAAQLETARPWFDKRPPLMQARN